jgi:hypothetical protein
VYSVPDRVINTTFGLVGATNAPIGNLARRQTSLNTPSSRGFSGTVNAMERAFNSMTTNNISVTLIIEMISQ